MKNKDFNVSILENDLMNLVGDSFVGFKSDDASRCTLSVRENLDDTKWIGKWTEPIRAIVRRRIGGACVCVKPIVYGESVHYKVAVA